MPRRPEIGAIQLYPNRPLTDRDKNGFVLKFYCPLQGKRIRRNCGTRDRREARKILRECRERLLNGEYVNSDGAISENHVCAAPRIEVSQPAEPSQSWEDAVMEYRKHKAKRTRPTSLRHAVSRLHVAERIFVLDRERRGLPPEFSVRDVMTLDRLEFLQDQLLAGTECRYELRSVNTVNSMTAAVMAFVRFCERRGWIDEVPPVEKLETDEVMKGRPVTSEEFEQMLSATEKVVGAAAADSWKFVLRVLWESGFRVSDVMDFSWVDEQRIHPVWPKQSSDHATIRIPGTQKNRREQEIPMLPGLSELLEAIPASDRVGWIVNPQPVEYEVTANAGWFQPNDEDFADLVQRFSNLSIGQACCVSETTVRKWLAKLGIRRNREFKCGTGTIEGSEISLLRERAKRRKGHTARRKPHRMTAEHVGKVISKIGKEANVVVRKGDDRRKIRVKYASAHDLRRGFALRLINQGVSAETLKVVMRHSSFATTEKHYGAVRSAQSAAAEVVEKLTSDKNRPFVGGLMGGNEETPQLSAEELHKLKSLLNSI